MQKRKLGNSKLYVNPVGLGCMGFSHASGDPVDSATAIKTLRQAYEMGYDFFDTAEAYTGVFPDGTVSYNEELVGAALKGVRDKVVIATKMGVHHNEDLSLRLDSRPETIRSSVETSLKRLGTDYIDLYYQHRIDPNVEPETVAETMAQLGLYAGLRREEILALRWDCVFLDGATPYISVRRAWRSVNNRPVISTELKTPAAKRDIPIPGKLVECLKEAKEKSKSEYVISDRNGNALAESQFVRVWKYIAVRSTEERCYYTYVNGQKIKHVVKPKLGEHQPNNPKLVYTMDFQVTPHQLRHTYITNLIYASVDPKTVQYLAGHENSKVTMDIYAKVKYNKPAQLHGVINRAIDTSKKD